MTHRSALLNRLAAAGELELSFVENRSTGVVHVELPRVPPWMEDDSGPVADPLLNVALVGKTTSLCGIWLISAPGDRYVSVFADERICARCVRALGPHAYRAFEHPTSD